MSDRPASLVARIVRAAEEHPERVAVVCDGVHVSYRALIASAFDVAGRLRSLGIRFDEPVGIASIRGAEFVAGAIGAMAAGGCYLPLDVTQPGERLRMLVARSGIRLALAPDTCAWLGDVRDLLPVAISTSTSAVSFDVTQNDSQLAYQLFTSGSTGVPKLVPIEQRSVCALLDGIDAIARPKASVISTCVCPFSFDVSVWELFSALANAGTVHILSTGLTDPAKFVRYLADHAVTSVYIPPFVLDSFVDELHLCGGARALDRILVGVEPITQATLQRLRDLSPDLHILNGYGPTEATICSTIFPFKQAHEPNKRTPIGWPVPGWRVDVVDSDLSPVADGANGEIVVGGPGLARGYVGDPALTEERFVTDAAGDRRYRTGDVGRRLPSGALEFVGRSDDQIKIRGYRVEIGEVEAALNSCAGVRASVVLALEGVAGRRLEAFVESLADSGELRRQLGRKLPEYMVPSRVIAVDHLPLTENGKVDRTALLALGRSRPMKEGFRAPSGQVQNQLAAIWREVLELDCVGVDDNFFDLGGNSLLALAVARRSAAALGHPALAGLLLRHATIAAAVTAIEQLKPSETHDDAGHGLALEDNAPVAASFGQAGLWTFQQLNPGNIAFVLPIALRISGLSSSERLVRAIELLVERHEAFRLQFRFHGGQLQQGWSSAPLQVEADARVVANTEVADLFRKDAAQVASLNGPPARARIIAVEGGDQILLLTAHHLAFDGSSLPIIASELAQLLIGHAPGPPQSARAFAQRQRSQVGSPTWQSESSYWVDLLAPLPDALTLPLDHPRLAHRSGHGRTSEQALSDRALDAVAGLAHRSSTTPFAVILTALGAMAHRFSGQDDFAVATPSAARADERYKDAVGYFVNLLPIRLRFQREQGFGELLEATSGQLREGFARAEFPFEAMLEALGVQGPEQAARFTRFVVAQDVPSGLPYRAGEIEIREFTVEHDTAKFELLVFVVECQGRYRLRWEYDSDIFAPETIERFQQAVEMLLAGAVSAPKVAIGQIDLLSDLDRHRILAAVSGAVSDSAADPSLLDLFEEHVHLGASDVALEGTQGPVTYEELHAWALQIAGTLRASGVREEAPVVVLVERSPDFIAAILGVLLAGGCYVPIDVREPAERVGIMCETVDACHAIASLGLANRIPGNVAVMAPDRLPAAEADQSNFPRRTPGSLAYIMFTSGSTGRPKGVAIPDRAVVRLVRDQNFARFDSNDVFILMSSLGFDAATLEIWGALLNGGRLVVPDDSLVRDPAEIAAAIERSGVTAGFFNVSMFRRILDSNALALKGMHSVIVGGEALPAALVVRASVVLPHRALVNGYGPTENTTFSCCHRFTEPQAPGKPVPIGQAIARSTVLVVDECLWPVPVGVVGEILVGGAGLARGYLGDPQLTAERFVTGPGGERWFRTGDLGRLLPSGLVEFICRRDDQVKIRGFRVELGDVETALNSIPGVRATVVLASEGLEGRRLEAFVESSMDGGELRKRLARLVPEYMVPSRVVALDRFPLTGNGKLDRSALLALARSRPVNGGFTPPSGPLQEQLGAIWRQVLELDAVGVRDNFFELGGNSMLLVVLAERIRKQLGVELRIVDLLDRPTIAAVADFLGSTPKPEPAPPARVTSHRDRIAVVGLAGRFPGAPDAETFWERTLAGEADLQDVDEHRPGFVARRGVLAETDRFDAEFFGIAEHEAKLLDPQQRVLLEVAQHALDDAGLDPAQENAVVAVYAACGPSGKPPDSSSLSEEYEHSLANAPDFAAMRISYRLRLRGESVTVQTGCSSSLFAVHLACRSLLSGQCDVALAGGVSFASDQSQGYAVEEGMITSPSGYCRPFDALADGTVPGGGAAMVVLMRLEDAERNGACVRALVIGSASNNDGGTKVGFMAPSPTGQSEAIAAAHSAAGVEARSIGYVETHGTATRLGDAIEIEGLRRAFALSPIDEPCALGSLKANCGHLDRAAGIAGFVRAVLVVERGIIPPMAGFNEVNSALALRDAGFMVPRTPLPWPRTTGPRRVGVSAFGVGGTNVHVVLEQAPAMKVAARPQTASSVLLALSGHTPEALAAQATALADHLDANPENDLRQVARTLANGRRTDRYRRFLVVARAEDALEDLRTGRNYVSAESAPRLVFAFPGHGDADVDGFAELYQNEPVYRAAIDRCAEQILSNAGFDIREDLYFRSQGERHDCFKDMSRHQPAAFAVEWALAELWDSWGVRPDVLIGHSFGEVVAAARAGVFGIDDATRLVVDRSRFMQDSPPGGMLSIPLSAELVRIRLDYRTSIAAFNGRDLVGVSGPTDAIASMEAVFRSEDVKTRRLAIPRAPHGPMMRDAAARLQEKIKDLEFHPPRVPLLSNVTGDWADSRIASPDYWAAHLTSPIQFSRSLEVLAEGPPSLVLVLGSGMALVRLIAYELGTHAVAVLSGSGDRPSALTSLGHLWAHGVPVQLAAPLGKPLPRKVRLPATRFGHHRRWPRPARSSASAPVQATSGGRNKDPGAWLWEPVAAPLDKQSKRTMASVRCLSMGDVVPGRAEFELAVSSIPHDGSSNIAPDVTDLVWWIGAKDGPNLLSRAGMIARMARNAAARVWVVVEAEESSCTPSSAALALAAVRVAPLEEPGADWHLIELRVLDPVLRADGLKDALAATTNAAVVQVAESGLLSMTVSRIWPEWRARPLREGGCYVITGGMGRVGKALARALAREVSAHIVFFGRRPIESVASELSSLQAELISSGTQLEYVQGDVTIRDQVAACLSALRQQLGRIDGIIHAAGFTDRTRFALLEATDLALVEEVSAAKLLGAQNLVSSLDDSDADFVFLCSSLSTVLGGVGFGAYVAANAALDDFARERWAAGDCRWISVGWEAWLDDSGRTDVGPSRYALSDEEGHEVFRRILAVPGPTVLVSTADIEMRVQEVRAEMGGERFSPSQNSDLHDSAETVVVDVLRDVLGKVPLDPYRDLREDGVESLTILQIVTRLRARLKVDISLANAMRSLTLAGLQELAARARGGHQASRMFRIKRVPPPPECPVSSTQRRWLELMPERFGGIDITVAVDGACDTPVLAQALRQVVQRHSGLRTRFMQREGVWVQIVEDRVAVSVHDFSPLAPAQRMEDLGALARRRAGQWFDVATTPPFDLDVIRLDNESHAVLIHAHHVVFDGWSSSLFLRDIARAVQGRLDGSAPQYTDYALAQNEYLRSPEFATIRKYWQDHFEGAPPPTRIPADAHGEDADDTGAFISFEIGPATLEKLRSKAKELRTTPFALMLAAYGLLLRELTGEQDLVIGTTAAGRPSLDTEEIIGVFVNPLPVRVRVPADGILRSYLTHVDQVLINFHEHQHYPLEDLVTHVEPFVGLGLNGAFHCYLLYQNYWRPLDEGLRFRRMNIGGSPHHKLMRELEIILEEHDSRLTGELWFRPSRFSTDLARSWDARYREILESLAWADSSVQLASVLGPRVSGQIVDGGDR